MKYAILLLASVFTSHLINAQTYWAGAESSLTFDQYKISDSHGLVRKVPLPGIEAAIRVRRMLNDNLFVEVAASTKPQNEGYAFAGAKTYAYSQSFQAVMLRADVGYRMMLTKKLALVPKAGVGVGANTRRYMGSEQLKEVLHISGSDIRSQYQETGEVNRFFGLLTPSLSLEQDLFTYFVLGIHAGYHAGFMKVAHIDGQYTVDQSPTYDASAKSNGSYWDVGLTVFYKVHTSR